MKRLFIKSIGKMWPTVIWQGTQLVVYYLGNNDDEVKIRETQGIDFDEFFLHLDNGGSIFITLKPRNRNFLDTNRKMDLEFLKELPKQGGF